MWQRTEPKGIELQIVNKYVDFKDKNILEVGCGNGRLTYQFADIAKKIVAIDPNAEKINQAKKDLSETFGEKLEFHIKSAEDLSFINDTFDIALFSYSLCCMDSLQSMQASMDEVQKKLKPGGLIIVLMDSLQMPFERGVITYLITNKMVHLVSIWDEEEVAKVQEAIFVLKHSTLIEKKLDLIAEEEFRFSSVYDTTEEALKKILDVSDDLNVTWFRSDRYENYLKLGEKIRNEIDNILESMTTSQGVFLPETTVLTVLRKSNSLI
ncbi:MAG: class I SAM-dependent methyltransferase [Candidatus Hodarchaeales archaeon]|jgi:ubiquinone/menaquinone biosynthesis C-methylase UbiE